MSLLYTLIVTIPGLCVVTKPFSTVAISLLDEVHTRLSSNVFVPLYIASYSIFNVFLYSTSCFVEVNLKSSISFTTVIVIVLVYTFKLSDIVIVTVPDFLVVTIPTEFTVAISSSLDSKVNN